MKLTKKIFITGQIKAETGLHIGGSNMGMAIGGADSPVLRDPITSIPYIPGSSLKGKMRSLLEKMNGKWGRDGKACSCGGCDVCHIFGTSAQVPTPTRLIVRDAPMLESAIDVLEKSTNTDMPYTEVKTEVVINRVTSAANPRQIERVPAGAEFEMKMVLNIYQDDDEDKWIKVVEQGLRLLEDDYLGGSGTRGYGKVSFGEYTFTYKDEAVYKGDNQAIPMEE